MTIFKDRLPGSIPIKGRFRPSSVRLMQLGKTVLTTTCLVFSILVLLAILDWLAN